jgi:hypothetical protein
MANETTRFRGRSFGLPDNTPVTLTIGFASRKAFRCITDYRSLIIHAPLRIR